VRSELAKLPLLPRLELELEDWSGIEGAFVDGTFAGRTVTRAVTKHAADAARLLAIPGPDATFEVVLELRRENEAWLLALDELDAPPARLALRQPSYERLTEAKANDLDLRAFFEQFRHDVPVEDVPECLLGASATGGARAPRSRPSVLDTAMMEPNGKLEIFRYARRYLLEHYRTKSLRCQECRAFATCDGLHVNQVRASGYAPLQPLPVSPTPAP
jgi:hypothetical protein